MATNRMEKLRARRTDPFKKVARAFDEAIGRIREEDPIKYVIETMTPIEKEYTDNTFEEGDRVKDQLDKSLNAYKSQAEFRYQGSVTNDTHIRLYSDIDLLVIDTDFASVEPPGKIHSLYAGDPLVELKQIRTDCVATLKRVFPAVTVDSRGGKCISLSGGSLRRKIDVVIANWWNTTDYQENAVETFRGVKVLDASCHLRHENKPFWHNFLIDYSDKRLNGNLRKVCRFLKSVKYDAEPVLGISSYDIVSIAWNMPDADLSAEKGQELLLAVNARSYLSRLLNNEVLRNSLKVPNGMRTIFGENGASKAQLSELFAGVDGLIREVESALAKSYRKIQEARVSY